METRLEKYFEQVRKIRYEGEHGPSYAYLELLALTRKISGYIKPYPGCSRHLDAIAGINWMLNEYLGIKFSPRHQSIFELKRVELLELSDRVLYSVHQEHKRMEKEGMLSAA